MSEILNKPEVAKIYIDARGPRFGAAITTTVLAIALVTQSTWLLAAQGLVFLIGAVRGPQFTPYAFILRTLLSQDLRRKRQQKMCAHLSLLRLLALPLHSLAVRAHLLDLARSLRWQWVWRWRQRSSMQRLTTA
jgi:hypothetical protein